MGLEGLTKFASRQRLWKQNPDGTLTNAKDGTVIRPDLTKDSSSTTRERRWASAFRTFAGFYNYIRILTDPRIRGPFFRIFLWTFAFSAISVAANIRGGDASLGAP